MPARKHLLKPFENQQASLFLYERLKQEIRPL
jgi:hypothetical protein